MKKTEDINGWFNYSRVYDFLLSSLNSNAVFVECGAWLGKSSSYLCDQAQDKVQIFIIDSWLGSDNELDTNHQLANSHDIYPMFLENMGERKFKAIRKLSHEAVLDFEDNSCDVVFIDMNHSYEAVTQDIQLWLPKVKSGGYLAGHDYNKAHWPGVVDAVNELLPNDKIIIMDECWIYKNE